MEDIKVLAFDTGGTVLDWHAGLTAAFAAWGAAQGIERDWHALANEHRRRSLHRMINTVDPGFNIGDVHRDVPHRSGDTSSGLPTGHWSVPRCFPLKATLFRRPSTDNGRPTYQMALVM